MEKHRNPSRKSSERANLRGKFNNFSWKLLLNDFDLSFPHTYNDMEKSVKQQENNINKIKNECGK